MLSPDSKVSVIGQSIVHIRAEIGEPMSKQPIFVTQPYLPPFDEFMPYLEKIWINKVLTNNGAFRQKLESALRENLDE